MMSTKGRQEIPDKQIVDPLTLEQRMRRDVNRAARTRQALAHVMELKTVSIGDKPEVKGPTAEQMFVMAVRLALRKFLTKRG